jgi:hypothetical protein
MPVVKAVGTPWGSRWVVDAEDACVSVHLHPFPVVLPVEVDAENQP